MKDYSQLIFGTHAALLAVDAMIGAFVLLKVFALSDSGNASEVIIDAEAGTAEAKEYNDRLPAALQSN